MDSSPDQARGVMVVRLRGEVDLAAVPRLRAALVELDLAGRHRLEVELHLVDHLDSSGLGVLLGALRRARVAGGDLRVVTATPEVRRLFDLLGLTAVFGLPATATSGADRDANS